MACFEKAIDLSPEYAEAHHCLSTIRLVKGDFEAAWPEAVDKAKRAVAEAAERLTLPRPPYSRGVTDAETLDVRVVRTWEADPPAGVEPLELWQALRLGVIGKQSPLHMLTKQFLPGKFETPAFALKLAHKDMMLGTNLAKELGVPLRLANLTLEEMTEALGRGWGEQDSRAYMKLQLERAGVRIAVDPQQLQDAADPT